MADKLSIGIDIGGTKIAAGVVDEDGHVIDRARLETPSHSAADVLEAIGSLTSGFLRNHHVHSVGIGAAGFVDASQSTVVFSPHLAWRNEPLRDAAARRTGLPVLVDNDANCAGWAEHRFGAAQNQSDLVLITLGTGIGGAIVLDGQPYRGQFGLAGEFGHMQVVPGGRDCECGNSGCWEQYASGRVLMRRAIAEADAGSSLGQQLLEDAGHRDRIAGWHVTDAANAGDEQCREWIAEVGDWLGVGIANLAAALDPGIFVIGGGVSDAGEMLLAPARAAFARTLTGRGFRDEARITRAHLGPEAGLIGAADMARLAAKRRRPGQPGSSGSSPQGLAHRARATGRATARPTSRAAARKRRS